MKTEILTSAFLGLNLASNSALGITLAAENPSPEFSKLTSILNDSSLSPAVNSQGFSNLDKASDPFYKQKWDQNGAQLQPDSKADDDPNKVKPPDYHKEGPMPTISDSLFSLIILIYVSVIFVVMFFSFCWKEPEHPGQDGSGESKNIPMITSILEEMEKQIEEGEGGDGEGQHEDGHREERQDLLLEEHETKEKLVVPVSPAVVSNKSNNQVESSMNGVNNGGEKILVSVITEKKPADISTATPSTNRRQSSKGISLGGKLSPITSAPTTEEETSSSTIGGFGNDANVIPPSFSETIKEESGQQPLTGSPTPSAPPLSASYSRNNKFDTRRPASAVTATHTGPGPGYHFYATKTALSSSATSAATVPSRPATATALMTSTNSGKPSGGATESSTLNSSTTTTSATAANGSNGTPANV